MYPTNHHSKTSSRKSHMAQGTYNRKEKFGQQTPLQNNIVMPGSIEVPVHSNTSESIINVTLTDNDRKVSDIVLLSQPPTNPEQ